MGRSCLHGPGEDAIYYTWQGSRACQLSVQITQVVRQLSQCSLEEMNLALGGFPDSCLEGGRSEIMEEEASNSSSTTPAPPSTSSQPGNPPTGSTTSAATSQPSPSPHCQDTLVEKQLSAFTGYVRYSILVRGYPGKA